MYLRLTGGLLYYIRPDYDLFTFLMGIALFVAGSVSIILIFNVPKPRKLVWDVSFKKLLVLICISAALIIGIVIPKRALSSATALRRGSNQNSAVNNTFKSSAELVNYLSSSSLTGKSITNTYNISDWIGLFQIDPEPETYKGKTVNVEGFVQPQRDGTFMVTRFVISCCIADATPIGLLVDRKLEHLKADDWVIVKGVFEVKTINGSRQDVIKPDSIELTSAPGDPYLY